jgi:hypothetical protein
MKFNPMERHNAMAFDGTNSHAHTHNSSARTHPTERFITRRLHLQKAQSSQDVLAFKNGRWRQLCLCSRWVSCPSHKQWRP